VKATLRIPTLTPGFALLDENFVSRGFGLATRNAPEGREAQWTLRQASGPQTLYYRALVYRDSDAYRRGHDAAVSRRNRRARRTSRIAMEGLIAEVRRQSADVASFTTELLRISISRRTSVRQRVSERGSLLRDRGTGLRPVLLRMARRSCADRARPLLRMQPGPGTGGNVLEVHDGVQWLYFNPRTLEAGSAARLLHRVARRRAHRGRRGRLRALT
jgi:hypothetical protein